MVSTKLMSYQAHNASKYCKTRLVKLREAYACNELDDSVLSIALQSLGFFILGKSRCTLHIFVHVFQIVVLALVHVSCTCALSSSF